MSWPTAQRAVDAHAEVELGEPQPTALLGIDAAHLASWAGLCQGNNESAGKHRTTKLAKAARNYARRSSNAPGPPAEPTPTSAPNSAVSTAASAKQAAPRQPPPQPTPLIVIIWHVLAQTTAYRDLGSDYFTRRIHNPDVRKQRLIRELEALGHKVILEPTAA